MKIIRLLGTMLLVTGAAAVGAAVVNGGFSMENLLLAIPIGVAAGIGTAIRGARKKKA